MKNGASIGCRVGWMGSSKYCMLYRTFFIIEAMLFSPIHPQNHKGAHLDSLNFMWLFTVMQHECLKIYVYNNLYKIPF